MHRNNLSEAELVLAEARKLGNKDDLAEALMVHANFLII